LALPLYAATLFVSAFILFLVQPMIGKLILPKLGGTPQVWNTCMVFFQMVLLAGYAYTHTVSTRLSLRQQLLIHGILLLLPLAILLPQPFFVGDWVPDLGVNPIPSTLLLLVTIVGLPFFVVSTSAPLLQKWFVHTGHPASRDPYFLYGASNLGSMLALLAYPSLIEPFTRLNTQTWIWTFGYVTLIVFVIASIGLVWMPSARREGHLDTLPPAPNPGTGVEPEKLPPKDTGITAKAPASAAVKPGTPRLTPSIALPETDQVTWGRRFKWIALAAVPSSMMLGVTTHITTDLSPVPLIWLIPLTLYLLSFILVFARWPVVWTEEPHRIMVYIQPVAVGLMLLSDFLHLGGSALKAAIFIDILGFFFITMVCHGELAKDRPSTRYLTDFYLMMSVGGVLGGMFNALFAPHVQYLFEFQTVIVAAFFLRPVLRQFDWADSMLAGLINPAEEPAQRKGKGARAAAARAEPSANAAVVLDIVLGVALGIATFVLITALYTPRDNNYQTEFIAYAIPIGIACLFFMRPTRIGLIFAGIVIGNAIHSRNVDPTEFRTRGYFGLIKVSRSADRVAGEFRQMIHGHINHGMNFLKPNNIEDWGNPQKDYSRLATTYYHRFGPAGIVMEKFNWFNDAENHFNSDSRICASLVASANPLFGSLLPSDQLAALWSEPAYATIGLGTGTMASYARPYQHMHFYEIDNLVRGLSLRPQWPVDVTYQFFRDADDPLKPDRSATKAGPQFSYLRDALARGVHLQVLMGDARLRMNLPYKNFYEHPEDAGGPESFYHMMVVDAFSSDAIPAHLITKQGIEMYFKHLTEEGVLCVHTSNRFVDLPLVVGDVAADLGFTAKTANDPGPDDKIGHFQSEWVMVARKPGYLRHLTDPPGYRDALRAKQLPIRPMWSVTPSHGGRYLWTDDFYNILSVMN
jgi:hypothetical protein